MRGKCQTLYRGGVQLIWPTEANDEADSHSIVKGSIGHVKCIYTGIYIFLYISVVSVCVSVALRLCPFLRR